MANCLWNFVFAALVLVVAARGSGAAAVVVDTGPTGKSHAEAQQDLIKQLWGKIESSFDSVGSAAEGMAENFGKYLDKSLRQMGRDIHDYGPHVEEFVDAIPAPVLHKMSLDFVRTALKHSEDHCGKVGLRYNPIHPGLTHETRSKRDADPMTLAKFGQAISTVFTNIDDFVVQYVTKSQPMLCDNIEKWLKRQIAQGEAMDPEEFKKKSLRFW